ncbi:MAG: methyltransferase domain-containing protein [Planctomycetaceae bacterium]
MKNASREAMDTARGIPVRAARDTVCGVCGNARGNAVVVAREMMFGLRDTFEYLECADCGCLQLIDPPGDYSPYYRRGDYYSFGQPQPPRWWKRWLRRVWARHSTGQRDTIGAIVASVRGEMLPRSWFTETGVVPESRILDVGCGGGGLLALLNEAGFHRVEGCDPFIDEETVLKGGARIHKKTMAEMVGPFDLVMMHHSLEHMPDTYEALKESFRLLTPGGWCLVRIPISSCVAWRTYRADWVQLDPPRHLFVHSVASLSLVAHRVGFRLARVMYDSTEFQFWASEQYRRGIPLNDPLSRSRGGRGTDCSPKEMEIYRRDARRLNATGEGDQAAFFLHRPD